MMMSFVPIYYFLNLKLKLLKIRSEKQFKEYFLIYNFKITCARILS